MKCTTLVALAGALMIAAPVSAAADILYNFKFDKTTNFYSDPSLLIRVVVEGQATLKIDYPFDSFYLDYNPPNAVAVVYVGGEKLNFSSGPIYVNVAMPGVYEEFPGTSFTVYNRFIGSLVDENGNDVVWLSNEGVSMYIDGVHHFWQVANQGETQYWTAVPEPTTWAILIVGFGFVGLAARRHRSSAVRTR